MPPPFRRRRALGTTEAVTPTQAPHTSRAGLCGPASGLARVGLAVAAGAALLLSFPRFDLWWAGPVGVALLLTAVAGSNLRAAYGLAVLTHLTLFLPLLEWTRFLGPVPWLLLCVLQALIAGLAGPALAVAVRSLPLAALPIGVASAVVLTEAVRSRVPYGGFTWGRLAFGQADGPGLGVAALGGAPLVSAVVAASGAGLVLLVVAARTRSAPWAAAGLLAALLPVTGLLASAPSSERSYDVAAVQGNVPEELTGLAEDREVLDNHVEQTLVLADDVRSGRRTAPDLVVWPENSVDTDPRTDAATAAAITRAQEAVGRPLVVGAVLRDGPTNENSIFLWEGGVPEVRYAKKHLVPFGEYLPHRQLLEGVYPPAGRLLPRDFAPGSRVGVLDVDDVRLAVATCYEVAFDDLPRDAVRAGGQILVLPSNNASYGRSAESAQQLAMARLRAVEHGRSAVVATTSGISALVRPDGDVVARAGLFEPAVLQADLPLSSELTFATRYGPAVELLLVVAGLGVALAVRATSLRRTGGSHRPQPSPLG